MRQFLYSSLFAVALLASVGCHYDYELKGPERLSIGVVKNAPRSMLAIGEQKFGLEVCEACDPAASIDESRWRPVTDDNPVVVSPNEVSDPLRVECRNGRQRHIKATVTGLRSGVPDFREFDVWVRCGASFQLRHGIYAQWEYELVPEISISSTWRLR